MNKGWSNELVLGVSSRFFMLLQFQRKCDAVIEYHARSTSVGQRHGRLLSGARHQAQRNQTFEIGFSGYAILPILSIGCGFVCNGHRAGRNRFTRIHSCFAETIGKAIGLRRTQVRN